VKGKGGRRERNPKIKVDSMQLLAGPFTKGADIAIALAVSTAL
jgi:hypothetical protein